MVLYAFKKKNCQDTNNGTVQYSTVVICSVPMCIVCTRVIVCTSMFPILPAGGGGIGADL